MSAQHTPGPWAQGRTLLTRQTAQWSEAEWDQNDKRERCMVFADFNVADEGRARRLLAVCYESEADARLIAAAPELLKALQECRNAIQGGTLIEPYDSRGAGYEQTFGLTFLEYLNAAIAKATGGQS